MWNTRACEIPTNLHGQLVRLYREVMLEHDSSWLGIQFILGSSYTAICATATWPCMSKLSQSKRRRRATGKNRMLKQANSTSNMDLTSNTAQWPVGTEYLPGISFPFLGKSAPVQYCTKSQRSEVQNAMQWKAVCRVVLSAQDPSHGFQGFSSVRLVYHFGPRPNQKPAPSQTERAAAHSSTSPWKS